MVDAVEKKWVLEWEKKGFAKKANPDLWKRFLNVYRKHKVNFVWVKGTRAYPKTNVATSWLPRQPRNRSLKADVGFEQAQ